MDNPRNPLNNSDSQNQYKQPVRKAPSENLGGLAGSEEDVREIGGAMGNILRVFRDFINDIITIAAKIGDFLSGNWLGKYTPQ